MARIFASFTAVVSLSSCTVAPSNEGSMPPASNKASVLRASSSNPVVAGVSRPALKFTPAADPFTSTYRPLPSTTTAIVNATLLTGVGTQIERGSVLMDQGRIVAVGRDVEIPATAVVVDARGKWVTPGIIDVHSHIGVNPAPTIPGTRDESEWTDPNGAGLWVEHSIWPQDPSFLRALSGGVTTLQILPGSGNLLGGRSVVLKNVPANTVQAMKFPGAPYGLKMACGENPNRIYGAKGRFPSSLMGNVNGYRRAWIEATEYMRRWQVYEARSARGEPAEPPKRDLTLETLASVLSGAARVDIHCYRADQMAVMLDIAKEYGFNITTFHHASEAYKIVPLLRDSGVCVATWAEWWGYKMEALDGVQANAPLLHRADVCTVIHSDDANLLQYLNQESALAMAAGQRAGIDLSPAEAIAWITSNAARALGIEKETGSLEAGKMADVVVWSGDPFSVYTKAEMVFIDGGVAFDHADPRYSPRSDFELGRPGANAQSRAQP